MAMSAGDRIDDICRISGMSEDIVRRVLTASRESLVKSLRCGERATLPGIVTATPEVRGKLAASEREIKAANEIRVKAKISNCIESELKGMSGFDKGGDDDSLEGILCMQIETLI